MAGGGAQPEQIATDDLRDAWSALSLEERLDGFLRLSLDGAEELFLDLPARDQAELVLALPPKTRRGWVRLLPPDDAADLIQEAPEEHQQTLLALLDATTRQEVNALLAYEEDDAGGLMNPRFARLRPNVTVDEAIRYLRKQALERLELIYYLYVLDERQRLLGVVSFRDLFSAPPDALVRDVMHTDVVSVRENQDQESVGRTLVHHDLFALPVVDDEGGMKGIVTVDDAVDVVEEEATEDVQKLGGTEALDEPYPQISFLRMVRKRGVWLAALFVGEMLTATAMSFYEDAITSAVVLAVFVPLIISSGGNSGSQASTLVVRAMALGELRPRDWWRVVRREVATGAVLGAGLGTIGLARVLIGNALTRAYGEHALRVGVTLLASLVGVVTFGTLAGSLLPFLLRRAGLDPASASAPLVSTLVDVTGLVIYFSLATAILRGALL